MAHAIILAHESDLVLLGMQTVLANDKLSLQKHK
jgi:hypothetical protein